MNVATPGFEKSAEEANMGWPEVESPNLSPHDVMWLPHKIGSIWIDLVFSLEEIINNEVVLPCLTPVYNVFISTIPFFASLVVVLWFNNSRLSCGLHLR